ncbi:protein SUPPRESSOR OF npr1-1, CONSTITUTIVE 1-like [Macadamia integrifolia]|uniref:protein SUPPRESSOR OF npr1-1, CONSTITUTIVE 1-like n=1 Tax=Macadamia integrifolia TaxID=60698 RepID=UPI001C4E77B8|nr:protein SUPPRESSOR OF npr1-1, CONSTITUTIVE 1-like [Macadamia integrifolia]
MTLLIVKNYAAIDPALSRTIEGSKITIPVFSSGDAPSKWCLQELSLIHDCCKTNGQIALPIFLDVEPSYVRNQTGSFEGPFQEHKRQFMPQIVENWREALRVIWSLKGSILNKDTNGPSPTEPSNGEILQLLGHKGTDKIKGMILPTGLQSVPLASEHFEMKSNLRFLDINSVHFKGDFPLLPLTLNWFRWKCCPLGILPANFYHKRLVNLDLSGSMIEEAWNIRSQNENKRFQNLKVLVLSDCTYLAESPGSSWFPHLEQLDLGNCRSLEKLNESIGQFSQLKNLNLKCCDSLKKLPDSIGELKSLVQLDLSWLKIEELPNSISRLSSLEELSLEGCSSLKSLPESIGDLKSLVELKLTNVSKIKELPDGVGLLEKLMVLDAYGCYKLVKLPRSMGRMRCLHSISLEGDNISNIPDDFSMLSNLFKLKMSTRLKSLPTDLSHLKYLKQLNLFKCAKLEYLPELPLSLVELHCEDCFSLVRLPDLSRLKVLAILCLEGCIKLEEIRGVEGVLSFVELNARGCHNLTITPRKILGQGTLLPDRPPLGSFSLSAIDGIYKKLFILCLVLELPSDFRSQTIYCDISASVRQKDKTTSSVHTLRIEDVEFTTHRNIIYLHHFKGFDWFGIPLQGKDAIENIYLFINLSYITSFLWIAMC